MPLEELPPNLIRSPNDRQHGTKERGVEASGRAFAKPPPSAVSGMLKNDTEVGDIGMFAHRPRVPRSATQSSFASQSRATASSSIHPGRQARPAQDHEGRSDRAGQPGVHRAGSVRSSVSGYNYAPRTRRPSTRPLQSPHQYHTRRNLHSHRSLASLRSAGAPYGPTSPYFQPYRTASPAISNVYEYRYPQRSRNGSFRSDPASPASAYTNGRSLQEYRIENNVSAASFRPLSSPLVASNRAPIPRRISLSRAMTPVSVAKQFDSGHAASPSEPASPTESIVPFYYDYSESFHGRNGLSPPEVVGESVSDASNQEEDVSALVSARTLLVNHQGCLLSPTELPTKHNRRPSEQSSKHSRKASSKSSRSIHVPSHQTIDEEEFQEHDMQAVMIF